MSDSILFREPAGVNQSARRLHITQGKAHVDPCLGRRLNLGEDVVSVQRHNRLTRTRL